jgi:hypothetical protein
VSTHPLEAIFAYAKRAGVAAISQYDGCWEVDVDGRWWFAVNGHALPEPCSRGPSVQPFGVYVEYHGWPAALLDVNGEGLFAAGEAATAEAFVTALEGLPAGPGPAGEPLEAKA